jgi:hypothetical protein
LNEVMKPKFESLTTMDLAKFIQSILTERNQKDTTLKEKAMRLSREILNHRYRFDKKERDATILIDAMKDETSLNEWLGEIKSLFLSHFFLKPRVAKITFTSKKFDELKVEGSLTRDDLPIIKSSNERFPDLSRDRFINFANKK